jgi:hypothetical protein
MRAAVKSVRRRRERTETGAWRVPAKAGGCDEVASAVTTWLAVALWAGPCMVQGGKSGHFLGSNVANPCELYPQKTTFCTRTRTSSHLYVSAFQEACSVQPHL